MWQRSVILIFPARVSGKLPIAAGTGIRKHVNREGAGSWELESACAQPRLKAGIKVHMKKAPHRAVLGTTLIEPRMNG